MRDIALKEYEKRGIILPEAQRVLDRSNMAKMAYDAALQTSPNAGVPVEFTYYLDPRVFEVPKSPMRAREVFSVTKKGDWTTSHARFSFHEIAGKSGPYSDYSDTPESYANTAWPTAENYVFQTNIRYGLREQELMGEARIDYASQLQRSAYLTLEQDNNRFWLLGIDNMNIYGILNDPGLPPAITTANDWTDTAIAPETVAADYRAMVLDLMQRTRGMVTPDSTFKLLVSPAVSVALGANSQHNQTARDLIEKYTPNLSIVIIPELDGLGTGGTAMLVCPDLLENPTAELGTAVQFQAGAIVQKSSTLWVQKVWASTYGCLYYYPFAVSRLTGVEG